MSEILEPTAIPSGGAHIPESPGPAPERLSKPLVFALLLSQLGISVPAVGMFTVSFPLTIAAMDPSGKANALSLLTGLYAVVGILISPIAGAMSDRCTSRFGMRRPFLLGGGLLSVASMIGMAVAPNFVVLLLCALLYSAGAGVYAGGNAALVPDQVPERHRGKIMGLNQVMLGLGGVIASVALPLFIGNQFLVFAVPAAFMAVAAIVVLLVIRDRHISRDELTGPSSVVGLLSQFKINPRTIPDYSWAWVGKAVTTLGTVLTTVYSIYYLTDKLKVTPENLGATITMVSLIGLATSISGALIGAWISDRFKIRKKMVLYTSLMIAVGAVVSAFAPSVPVYVVGAVIMGLGMGAYFPVDGALMIDVLPGQGKESGKYMGLMTLADQVPRSVGPFLAAGVLAAGAAIPNFSGYSLVFIAGGVIAVIGGGLVRMIKGSR